MNLRELKILIEKGEGFGLEFKRKVSSPVKIAKTLLSFANTKGGIILFGVDDDRRIVGVSSEKEEMEMINTAAGFYCDPPVEMKVDMVPYNGRDVIVVNVEESDKKPHYLNDDRDNGHSRTRVYIRVNDKSVEASKEVVRILQSESPDAPPLRIAIGDTERRLFDFLDKNERVTVKKFAEMVNVSDRRASRLLIRLVRAGILRIHTSEREDYYTRAF
jgi:predicted HTH transcriptional regulator